MVNFNPQEEMSLENLLAALQGGLDPNQGYGILSDILAQQQARAQTRKENMQAYASTLEGMAQVYPDRRSAMTAVNAWDTANMVGPNQAGTLRDTVRALYPEGRGTPSPLFDMSNLPAPEESGATGLPTTFADVPTGSQSYELNQMYNSGAYPEMYTETNDIFDPALIEEQAMMVASGFAEAGIPPEALADAVYMSLIRAPEIQVYASRYPGNVRDIATRAAMYFSNPATLGMLSGAG